MSGRAPFSGPEYRGTLEKINAHVHQPAPPIRELAPDVPEELAAVVDRMLAKNPGDRFATPAEVAAAFTPFCAGANLLALWDTVNENPLSRRKMSDSGPLSLRERARVRGSDDSPLSLRDRVRVRAGESEGGSHREAQPAPIHRRPIVWRIAIGVAFFGVAAIAFFAGMLITINRGGETYKVTVPRTPTRKLVKMGISRWT